MHVRYGKDRPAQIWSSPDPKQTGSSSELDDLGYADIALSPLSRRTKMQLKKTVKPAVAMVLLSLAMSLQPVFATVQGQQRQDARDTRQTGRNDARDTKQDCRADNQKSNSDCRQDKRGSKQDARQTGRDIKY
jgi:hypothetical protein